jgi:hypothetical protein
MSQSKNKDFSGLQAALAVVAQPVPTPELPPAQPPSKRPRGRPVTDTEPLQLRIAPDLRKKLMVLVMEEIAATGRNVTLQQIILRILEDRVGG